MQSFSQLQLAVKTGRAKHKTQQKTKQNRVPGLRGLKRLWEEKLSKNHAESADATVVDVL